MEAIASHSMFVSSRANPGRRDSIRINCDTTAPVGCVIRVSLVELSAPEGSFGDSRTGFLRMKGASLTARESEGLAVPPAQAVGFEELSPSSILGKFPIPANGGASFQSPFLLYASNRLNTHHLGHFTLEVGDATGQLFGDIVGAAAWTPDAQGVSAAYFEVALKVEIVKISEGDGGGDLTENHSTLPQADFLTGVQTLKPKLRQYAA